MLLILAVRVQGTPLVIGIPLAFLGGLLSFVSPCVLPLVPGYFGYLAGASVADAAASRTRTLLLNGVAFVVGFSAVFTVVGVAIGQVLTSVQLAQGYVRWVGGVVIIILGFHTLGLIRLPFLDRTVKLQPDAAFMSGDRARLGIVAHPRATPECVERAARSGGRQGVAGMCGRSFMIGVFFAAGWSPCVGPILAGIYGVAGSQPANGGVLLFVYSLGLGVPFLCVALLFGKASGVLRRVNRWYGVISIVSGLFLIAIGCLLLTDTFIRLAQYAPAIGLPGVT